VDRGIAALEARDAGAAALHFSNYLGTGPCNDGSIGVPPTLAERPQASFDLGLALFQIAERFGGRFGEDQGREEDNPRLLAARSAEVACALSVLEQIVGRRNLPLELTAQAHYLLGNLEFLRREYKAAVTHYNRALELIPGDDAQSAQDVGRDAAHNRALALRRAEEDKPKPPHHPDAGPEPGDAGAPKDQPPEHGDAGQPSPKGDQNKDQKGQDQNKDQDQQQPDQPKDQDQKSPDQQDQQQDQHGKNQPAPQQSPQGQEPKQTPPPEQHAMSLSQDDKTLDQLERAPTVQQEAARAQRGRVRRVVEDK
jgi:tetratricopeptide (TPR) repeat protein